MASQPSLSINPGPLVPDLLFSHDQHRARSLFHGSIPDCQLKVRRCDSNFWRLVPFIPERVMYHIRRAGFEGVIRCGYIQLDHALITALVERWRPETHTFHFPTGEATVTLQDVEVLWGLSTSGIPVCGTDNTLDPEIWIRVCQNMLGFTPPVRAIINNRIQLSCLYDILSSQLPDDASEEMCIQRARTYILSIIGGHLLSDLSSSTVYMHHLVRMTDIDDCSRVSLGSAILACLYRRLCKATSPSATEICGPLVLLQLWAWERLPTIRPMRIQDEIDFTRPYGARWNVNFGLARVPTHVLPAYRDQLASLRPDQFIWLPYPDDVVDHLPRECSSGRASWLAVTYLLCWEIVEPHLPNRVMRQFGMHQPIPVPRLLENHVFLHRLTRSGRPDHDWVQFHRQYHDHWANRLHHVESGELVDDPTYATTEYMTWYWERTVTYITNPSRALQSSEGYHGDGETTELLMDGLCRVLYHSLSRMAISDSHHSGYFAEIRDIATHYMHLARGQHRLQISQSHVLDPDSCPSAHSQEDQRVRRNARRGRQGGRRRRSPPGDSRVPNATTGGSYTNAGEHVLDDPYIYHAQTNPVDNIGTSSQGPFSPVQDNVISPHMTRPSITPVPFPNLLHSSEVSRVVPDASDNREHVGDPAMDDHAVIVDEDIPIARRRMKRTVKPTACGTHGRLGH